MKYWINGLLGNGFFAKVLVVGLPNHTSSKMGIPLEINMIDKNYIK